MNIKMGTLSPRKTVYVTGGLGLVGRTICKKFLESGYRCFALEPADTIASKNNVLQIPTKSFDVTDFGSIKHNVESFFGGAEEKPDAWVNCAYPKTDQFAESREGQIEQTDWRENVDIQLNTACLISSAVALQMSKLGGGAIVNIASIYGMRAPRFEIYNGTNLGMPPSYSAIKAGLINYTKQLAIFYAKKGVRLNCVSPGGVLNTQEKNFLRNYSRNVPIGRLAAVEEIASPVVFLCSAEASYITGINLPVDGGWTAQ